MRQGRHRARPEGARRPGGQRPSRVRRDRRAGEGRARAKRRLISSRDNEKLKLVRKLHDRRWRDKLGLFVAEGEDLVAAAGAAPVELLVAGENVEPALLAEVSTLAHPPRVIGVYRCDELPRGRRPVTVALWHVADPGNVGTLFRAADAFGAGVTLSPGCADPTGPKALRASMGSLFRVPTTDFESVEGRRIALVARGGTPLPEVDLSGEIVFLLGAEREGLPEELSCDVRASIPQSGGESLNVAMAGTIALYERSTRPAA